MHILHEHFYSTQTIADVNAWCERAELCGDKIITEQTMRDSTATLAVHTRLHLLCLLLNVSLKKNSCKLLMPLSLLQQVPMRMVMHINEQRQSFVSTILRAFSRVRAIYNLYAPVTADESVINLVLSPLALLIDLYDRHASAEHYRERILASSTTFVWK